jgi:diguanylate cyclase (GGDEF)-like protein
VTRSIAASRAARQTFLLTGALAAVAAAVTVLARTPPTLDSALPQWLLAAGLAGWFFIGEKFVLTIEFRRQAHSATLGGIPLAVGALLAPLPVVVLARVLGAVAALGLQRMRLDKLAYNVAAYAFEAALATAVIHTLLGERASLDVSSALSVTVALVLLDQLMSCLVLIVIRLHNGPLSRRDVAEVQLPAFGLSLVTASAALGVILLVSQGPVGSAVVVIATLAALGMYRNYITTTRRHHALELMHEFVAGSVGAESLSEAASELLGRVRSLLRASAVEMTVLPDDADVTAAPQEQYLMAHLVDSEHGFSMDHDQTGALDWATLRALSHGEPLLAPRTSKDRAVQGWLRERGYREAMMVPFPAASGLVGVMTVSDRLGETATFTADDLTMLQTLTGHLAVASKSARMVERLAYDANHDALTGLFNRAYLSRHITAPRAASGTPTVLLLDLDRFKEVNDTLGHAAGDRLLCVVADRLRAILPEPATIARLGGDEFAAYVPDLDGGEEAARELATRLAAALAAPVSVNEALLTADASIGVALAPGHNRADLLRQADTAMYAAKADDSTVAVYHSEMDRGRLENLALLADLRGALHQSPEQFTLYFQPKIELGTRTVVSAEALVRWNHPQLGVLAPARFIPLAETSGLIDLFTPLILDTALAEARRWAEQGTPISVAVNLSARNVGDPNLPEQIAGALARNGVPASQLIIEITESCVIAEPQQTLRVLNRLSALGVCISLDDFGTGYSSLSHLHRLPVQEVKIDRSFVQGLTNDAEPSRALISAITSLCTELGLRVVAEGAETDEVLDDLEALACDVAQGYTIARPTSAAEFRAWLREAHPARPVELHLLAAK